MSSSLKKQALQGAFWSFVERFGQQGIQFVISIILARLLEPKDFGVLGMIAIFTALANAIVDSGFGEALIQKRNADHTDASTVFWFNILAGLVMAGILCAAAPWIARFYGMPLLVPVTRIAGLNLFISSFGIIQRKLMVKEMAFARRMIPTMVAICISGAIGIILAFHGLGVWSLIIQGTVSCVVQTAGLWLVHAWRPAFIFSWSAFKGMWKFGSNMLGTSILTTFFDNIYMVVIGKVYSPAQLGFYQRGKRLMLMTSQSLSQVVGQVHFPMLAKIQHDPERMRRAFQQAVRMTMLINLPMMTGMAAAAPNLIHVLYGEKWMPCVPYLQVLCIIGIFYPMHVFNLDVVKALGRSDVFFRLEVIKKVLTVLNIAIMWRYGVLALLWGGVVCSALGLFINAYYTRRYLSYGIFLQIRALAGLIVSSLGMGFVVWAVGHLCACALWVELLLQIAAGSLVFVALEWMLKDPAFCEGMSMITGRLKWRK